MGCGCRIEFIMAVMQRTRGQELETTSDESDSVMAIANDSTNFGIHQWSTSRLLHTYMHNLISYNFTAIYILSLIHI